MRPLNRVPEKAPARMYTTFGIRAPRSTHWVPATCEEVQCQNYVRGFRTSMDESKPVGEGNAKLLRADKTRTKKEYKDEYNMTIFEYPPGTKCFNTHTKRLEKPEIYIVRDGDHRGNPKGTPTRTHTKAEFWTEEFSEVQDKIKKALERRD